MSVILLFELMLCFGIFIDDFDLPEELPPPISHENDTAVRKNSLDLKQVIQKAKEKELERQSYSPEIFGPPIHHKRPGAPRKFLTDSSKIVLVLLVYRSEKLIFF